MQGSIRDTQRADSLLEHIRHRTGLLMERRPAIYAFAHLTFQEYLAAQAVREGNRLQISVTRLATEHVEGRWSEVIPLFCRLAPEALAVKMINELIAHPDSTALSSSLAEAFLSSSVSIRTQESLRDRTVARISLAPDMEDYHSSSLDQFPKEIVAPVANESFARIESEIFPSEAYIWLCNHPDCLDVCAVRDRLRQWRTMSTLQLAECVALLHAFCPDEYLAEVAPEAGLYSTAAPPCSFAFKSATYGYGGVCSNQAEIALVSLFSRETPGIGADSALLQVLRVLGECEAFSFVAHYGFYPRFFPSSQYPSQLAEWREFVRWARILAERVGSAVSDGKKEREGTVRTILSWTNEIEERAFRERPNSHGTNGG